MAFTQSGTGSACAYSFGAAPGREKAKAQDEKERSNSPRLGFSRSIIADSGMNKKGRIWSRSNDHSAT